jgi:membrane protein DedA with SNARE-associated domain
MVTNRRLAVVSIAITIQTVTKLAALGFAPVLLRDSPLLFLALDSANQNLLLAATKVDFVPFLVIGALRRFALDPLFFFTGKWFGTGAIEWVRCRSKRTRGLVNTVERVFVRVSSLAVFLYPNELICVLAGATGMKPWRFMLLNVSGAICAVFVIRLIAMAASEPLSAIVSYSDRNTTVLTAIILAVVASGVSARFGWKSWSHRVKHAEGNRPEPKET